MKTIVSREDAFALRTAVGNCSHPQQLGATAPFPSPPSENSRDLQWVLQQYADWLAKIQTAGGPVLNDTGVS